jgi:uncharacterized protein (DUF1778 family)
MARAAPKTGRIELRTDRVSEKRIRLAASIARKSVSTFMLEAAAARAEEVIAQVHEVAVPAEYFDAFWKSLSKAPRTNRNLARLARKPRRFSQRW